MVTTSATLAGGTHEHGSFKNRPTQLAQEARKFYKRLIEKWAEFLQ